MSSLQILAASQRLGEIGVGDDIPEEHPDPEDIFWGDSKSTTITLSDFTPWEDVDDLW